MNRICLNSCEPVQILSLDIAVNDAADIEIYDKFGCKYDNSCLKWSYSLDSSEWSCWMSYEEMLSTVYSQTSDFWVKAKVQGSISKVTLNGQETNNWSTGFPKCFEFGNVDCNPNRYNPYANQEYAIGLYQQLSETVSSIVGIPIYYFKLLPNAGSKDYTFKEYALYGVDKVKQIKMIVTDGMMPSSKPEFSEFGFDFSTDWETEISKLSFATAFGNESKPMEGDMIYVPMMKRMWTVANAYEEKNEGFMWYATTYKVALTKYEDRGSVELGDMQDFVDSIVATKYEDIFGKDENRMSGMAESSSPKNAMLALYPIYESDAIRKYIKVSVNENDSVKNINSKLIANPKWHKGILVSENSYDWTSNTEESFIIYQKRFASTDGTLSFIIDIGNEKCSGKLFEISGLTFNIDIDEKCTISLMNLGSIELEIGKSYFIAVRWSKGMNILEFNYAPYGYPEEIPLYKLQKYHYSFDMDNIISKVYKYDIELEQCTEGDIMMYSFYGKISNIKIFDAYVSDNSILLQMYPTDQRLLVNDTVRPIVSIPGITP